MLQDLGEVIEVKNNLQEDIERMYNNREEIIWDNTKKYKDNYFTVFWPKQEWLPKWGPNGEEYYKLTSKERNKLTDNQRFYCNYLLIFAGSRKNGVMPNIGYQKCTDALGFPTHIVSESKNMDIIYYYYPPFYQATIHNIYNEALDVIPIKIKNRVYYPNTERYDEHETQAKVEYKGDRYIYAIPWCPSIKNVAGSELIYYNSSFHKPRIILSGDCGFSVESNNYTGVENIMMVKEDNSGSGKDSCAEITVNWRIYNNYNNNTYRFEFLGIENVNIFNTVNYHCYGNLISLKYGNELYNNLYNYQRDISTKPDKMLLTDYNVTSDELNYFYNFKNNNIFNNYDEFFTIKTGGKFHEKDFPEIELNFPAGMFDIKSTVKSSNKLYINK